MNQEMPDYPKNLWQEQPLEGTTMSVQQIRERLDKLGRQVRRRNLIGGFASITVLLCFAYFAAVSPTTLLRVGAALTALGAAYIAVQLVRRKVGGRGGLRGSHAEPSVAFYRSELERQRDFHRGFWLWSRFLLFIPGPALFLLGSADANPHRTTFVFVEASLFAGLMIWAIPQSLRAARRYQRELDGLDSVVQ